MKNLILEYYQKDYPYKNELYDKNIIWSNIKLNIVDKNIKKNILNLEWDFKEIKKWFINNKEYILNDIIPIRTKGSIAEKIFNFYDSDLIFKDEVYDNLFKYREKHGLRFAFRGIDIKDIYIGKNNNIYEISYFSENENWNYEIDIINFFKKII